MTTPIAALDGGPGPEPEPPTEEEIFADFDDGSIRWHWWHRWSPWGVVFSATSAGVIGFFSGGASGPWWQHRECVRCGLAQRRRVELREDRTVQQ